MYITRPHERAIYHWLMISGQQSNEHGEIKKRDEIIMLTVRDSEIIRMHYMQWTMKIAN